MNVWLKRILVLLLVCLVLIFGGVYAVHRYLFANNLFYIVYYTGYPILKLGDLPDSTPAWPIDSFTYEKREIVEGEEKISVMVPKYSDTVSVLGEEAGNILAQVRETGASKKYHWSEQTGYYRFCEKDLVEQSGMSILDPTIYDKYHLEFVSDNHRGIFGPESFKNFRADLETSGKMEVSLQDLVAKIYLQSDRADKDGLFTPLAVVLFDKRGDCTPLGSL